MNDFRAIVFAYSKVGYVCLRELIDRRVNVQAVFTHQDDPGEKIWFPSVAELAGEASIPVFTSKTLGDEEYKLIIALKPDVIFSFYYRSMIPERFLEIPHRGAYNIHGSLLPKYRGRAPVNWAILKGETETGATLHHLIREADGGPIVDQEKVPILFEDTAYDVSKKVAEAARLLLLRNLDSIAGGKAWKIPQKEADASYFGKRTPEDGRIEWERNAVEIYNLIRAVTDPFPGAFTFEGDKKLFIWKARPEEWPDDDSIPGMVISASPLMVRAATGCLRPLRVQWEGAEEVDGEDLGLAEGTTLGKYKEQPEEQEDGENPETEGETTNGRLDN